ncbi:MAG: ABC transporter ATP-binding protein [Patescibacteria group bacterium]|nr:ABC transporter ATP-binding protein [Patescibacteria group bacterium]
MLKLTNVSKIYQVGDEEVRALDDLSLEIKKGEFVAIIGASGSGKSTLLHVLGALDRPSSGKITWQGKRLNKMSDRELASFRNRQIGFVFQQFHLLPRTSVLENTMLPTIYLPADENNRDHSRKAKKILKELVLSDRLNHTPGQLSGGQQQRVAIARALINNPQIILADEPTGNLDSKSGEQILKILEGLNKKGLTVIVVTHDIDIAKKAKRQIIIKDGKIIKDTGSSLQTDTPGVSQV